MTRLRHAHHLIRLVLMWFVLSVGAAVASPLIHGDATQLVCSTGGIVKVMKVSGSGGLVKTALPHTLDCPACTLGVTLLPTMPVVVVPAPTVQAVTLAARPLLWVSAWRSRPQLARAPPAQA